MVAHKKLGSDVDIPELAGITKNFSGAELEGLVRYISSSTNKIKCLDLSETQCNVANFQSSLFRAAQSCALNRLVKADSKVEYF